MNTQDIAKQAGILDDVELLDSNQWRQDKLRELETFRTLCVAEEHKRLMALGMEPVKIEVTDQYGDAYGYAADQLAAARVQGADEAMRNQLNLRKYAEELQEKNAQLEAQLAQYKADAERYRWLLADHDTAEMRDLAEDAGIRLRWVGKGHSDATIDAAIAARKEDV